jgi:peptidoglycan/xylan/chitin deacetylase (PgdA/CDA1 family)
MAFLRRAYRVVTLDQLCRELNESDPNYTSSYQAVAITFDDGYRDLYTTAWPILRKYNLPATVYLTASAIETGEVSWYDRIFALAMWSRSETFEFEGVPARRFPLSSKTSRLHAASEVIRTMRRSYPNQQRIAACAELERKAVVPDEVLQDRMLTWAQIREMQESGITFGAHTMSHPAVGRLSLAECEEELIQSRMLLEERLQRPVEHFAFPFGLPSDLSPETCCLIPSFGYRSAASTVWGINTPRTNPYLLRRIGGEELSVSMLALYLRWFFLKDQPSSPEMKIIESALEKAHRPDSQAAGDQLLRTGASLA